MVANPYLGPGYSATRLLQTLAQHSTVPDGGNQADHINQAGHAVYSTEALVQSDHLLGVGSRVVALLSVTGF